MIVLKQGRKCRFLIGQRCKSWAITDYFTRERGKREGRKYGVQSPGKNCNRRD